MEFKLWGTGTTVLITPQAIDMAVETEHLEQKTVRIVTRHGDVVVLDPDRTVMAQIAASMETVLSAQLARLEIDLAYERQERKAAETAVAPLKAYVEQLQMLNDGLRHDLDEMLAGDPAIEMIREARAWAALWKRAAKRSFVHPSDRILLRMLHSAEAQAKRGEITVE